MCKQHKAEKMWKTLEYAYLDLTYLLAEGFDTNVHTLTSRLHSCVSSGDLESVANTLVEIEEILGDRELKQEIFAHE